jgi:uncharacterized protein YukE
MNPDEGRDVAQEVTKAGEQILDLLDPLNNLVNSVEWVGPDYETYRDDWSSFMSGPVNDLIEAFKAKGDELTNHAEEQDHTSNQN